MSELWIGRIQVLCVFAGVMAFLFMVGAYREYKAQERKAKEDETNTDAQR